MTKHFGSYIFSRQAKHPHDVDNQYRLFQCESV